ncbi:hypothetical protein RhiirA5_432855 [Rhizophagus irregularis]|uniref:Uncharacterized protein n=1 Tax=Rhizophagus irregularis TaxID=588596 RepID=A0A2N0NSP5_9GLOM|nr:hypothetical protein RhiirA5_432855 [Rhizophagus irregularis]
MKATNLLKNKGILFLEQLLEANRMKLMKWKHICVENECNSSGIFNEDVKINKNEIITWNENYNTLGVFTKNVIEIEIEISYRIFNLNMLVRLKFYTKSQSQSQSRFL